MSSPPGGGAVGRAAICSARRAALHPSESRWPSSGGGGVARASRWRARRRSGGEPDRSAARELGAVLAFELAVAGDAGAKPSRRVVPTSAPTTEGSGLIDIRAMAASTLGCRAARRPDRGDGRRRSARPSARSRRRRRCCCRCRRPAVRPKWIYVVIVRHAGLVGGIGFLAWKVITPKPVVVVQEVQVPAPAPAANREDRRRRRPPGEGKKPTHHRREDCRRATGRRQGRQGREQSGKARRAARTSRHHKGSRGRKEGKKAASESRKARRAMKRSPPLRSPPSPSRRAEARMARGAR